MGRLPRARREHGAADPLLPRVRGRGHGRQALPVLPPRRGGQASRGVLPASPSGSAATSPIRARPVARGEQSSVRPDGARSRPAGGGGHRRARLPRRPARSEPLPEPSAAEPRTRPRAQALRLIAGDKQRHVLFAWTLLGDRMPRARRREPRRRGGGRPRYAGARDPRRLSQYVAPARGRAASGCWPRRRSRPQHGWAPPPPHRSAAWSAPRSPRCASGSPPGTSTLPHVDHPELGTRMRALTAPTLDATRRPS